MIKLLKRIIKRRQVRKRLLKLQNVYDFVDHGQLTDIKDCLFIFRNTLKHPNSVFEIAPITYHRIIENKKIGIYIILNNKTITIINHVCYYSNIPLSDRDWNKITHMYDNKVQNNRMERIKLMKLQVEKSLHKLKSRIVIKPKQSPTI